MRLFALLTALLVGSLAQASMLVNGSFEDPGSPAFSYFSNGQLPGWRTTATDVIEVGKPLAYGVSGADLANVCELDSTRNISVMQDITLAAGQYDLSFLYAKRGADLQGKPADTCDFDVLWNGSVVASVRPIVSTMLTRHVTVNAINGWNTVSFRAMGTSDGMGAIIDNADLQTVPEPFSLVTLAGLAAGAVVRRKKGR